MGQGGTAGTRFIAAKMGLDSGRVFLSTTAGDNWVMVPDVVQPAGYNEWTNMISVHPRFSNRILAGAVGLSRTTSSFTFDPTSGTHSDHHQVVYDPVDPTTCYVATDGGVYRSLDGGATWALHSRGMTATQFYSVGVSQTSPLVLGGATQDQGVLKLRPGSELDWDDVHAGNEGGFFIVDPNDSRTIYTTPWSNNLRRSTDTGATWTDIRNGMTTTFNGATVGPATVRHLAVRFGLSSHLIAGGSIVVRDANDNEIFHQSRVYLSLTRGDAWVGRELTDGDVNRVAFSPAEPLDLLCGDQHRQRVQELGGLDLAPGPHRGQPAQLRVHHRAGALLDEPGRALHLVRRVRRPANHALRRRGRALDGPERDGGRRHARDPDDLDRGEPGLRRCRLRGHRYRRLPHPGWRRHVAGLQRRLAMAGRAPDHRHRARPAPVQPHPLREHARAGRLPARALERG